MESEHLRRKIVRSYYDRTTIVTIVVRSYDHNTIVSTIVLRSYFDRSTIVVRSKKSCDRKRSYYDRRQPVFFGLFDHSSVRGGEGKKKLRLSVQKHELQHHKHRSETPFCMKHRLILFPEKKKKRRGKKRCRATPSTPLSVDNSSRFSKCHTPPPTKNKKVKLLR